MDDPAANKNLMSCPVWPGQVNWAADPSQGAPLIPLSTQQQLGLGSSSDSRQIYDQIQTSGLNCLNNLPCRVNTQSTPRFKTSQMCSTSTSASLFANTQNVFSFAQLSESSLMQTTNHGKNTTRPLPYQTSQQLASFQSLVANQSLPSPFQPDLPVSLPSCSQQDQGLQSKETSEDSAPVSENVHSQNQTVSVQMPSEWRPNAETNESRSALIQQREELLKKLSDLDALLKTMPPDESEEASPAADPTPVSSDLAPVELPEESSELSECEEVPSENDGSPGFVPSEDDISESMDNISSDESSPKKPSCNTRLKAKSKTHSAVKKRKKDSEEKGLYISKGLFRHMKKCPEKIKNEEEPKIGKRRLAFRCVLETLVPDISEGFKMLLSPMINDPVTQAILNHKVILQFGEGMFKQQGADPSRHENIRQNLRQIARLVLEAQKKTPLKEMEDFFVPDNFKHVVSAVNTVAGYNSKSQSYSSPSLAIKLGYQLQKLCTIVESNAIMSGDESRAKSAQNFLEVYKEKWNTLVSASALSTLRETKRLKEESVPSVQDVKRLNSYVANVHAVAENKFREHVSAETYAALAKVILGRVILFNRRKPGEVAGLKLEDFLSRKVYDTFDYTGISLSDLERTMCRFFTRIEIRGNCGRIVPVLLKQSFVFGLELLVKNREACGNYVKDCGAESPKTLTTAKIRVHFAAMLQMLNLDENEANQILGPNYQVLQNTKTDAIEQHGTFEDIGTQTSAQWGQNQFSCDYDRPATYYPEQSQHPHTPVQSSVPKRAATDKPQRATQKNSKQKWDETEVRAVERHMMRFILGHKVPQKMDCLQCLDAEPEALRSRSWKGVKDFVRNRITALKREESRSALKTCHQQTGLPKIQVVFIRKAVRDGGGEGGWTAQPIRARLSLSSGRDKTAGPQSHLLSLTITTQFRPFSI
ncbi:hypothetical protein WMY93_004438 [Mugilogobius chulae]|uniref:Uncharacterized protein n=1 Tax=Mugilogobius chulae TaxID=88201 RepID=A0AAW0PNK3_9GOBI